MCGYTIPQDGQNAEVKLRLSTAREIGVFSMKNEIYKLSRFYTMILFDASAESVGIIVARIFKGGGFLIN